MASGIERLKNQDPWTITISIKYLKADIYCFRSGYIKITILKLLKNIVFTKDQIKQLQDILITMIKKTTRQEYRDYCRLARKIFDEKFNCRIQSIIQQSNDLKEIYRAKLMLESIEQEKRMSKKTK